MRKITLALLATSALALSAGAATAQGWRSIDARQAELGARLDAGVRSGDLNPEEARRLRFEYNQLADIEARYRSDGLSNWEANDLDHRFDVLAGQISYEVRDDERVGRRYDDNRDDRDDGDDQYDREDRRGGSLEQRKLQVDRSIMQGERSGQLTQREAVRLRDQFNAIARIEYRYRVNGLSEWERADLSRRFDQLAYAVRTERSDDNRRYGYNERPRY